MKTITKQGTKTVAERLGIDLTKYDLKELQMGMNTEQEHAESLGDSSWTTMARIAIDHLDELPDYYTRLKEMEK